jgi:predicted acylesterase/phospholipase RssA
MSDTETPVTSRSRRKIGLALSGGGFRASFFHLGTLRRLAELGLLRRVEVLSTVSGGSIIAAHYYLRLKEAMAQRPLHNDDYINIVDLVEKEMRAGVQKNLRTRLFANPLATLILFVTGGFLGQRMARLYTKHLFRKVLQQLYPADKQIQREGAPLHKVKFELWDQNLNHVLQADLETHNADPKNNSVPKFVLNSTCLNTACPFRFSITEIGDPQLGYLRFDEIDRVLQYKKILGSVPPSPLPLPQVMLLIEQFDRGTNPSPVGDDRSAPLAPQHLLWFQWCRSVWGDQSGREKTDALPVENAPETKEPLLGPGGLVRFLLSDTLHRSKKLAFAPFAALRRLKVSAWWLAQMPTNASPPRGGRTRDQWLDEFWDAMDDIDLDLSNGLQKKFGRDDPGLRELIMDLYFFRSAIAFATTVGSATGTLTLSHAVAASANFPPVFAPFRLSGIYDPQQAATVLALTDGGVFDNQGIEALRDEDCTDIIASDAGGLLSVDTNPSSLRIPMMVRVIDTLMSNVRGYQLKAVREELRVSKGIAPPNLSPDPEHLLDRYRLKTIAQFHMTSEPSDAPLTDALTPHPLAATISRIRTDLDVFCQTEADALIYQGYQLCDRFVRKYMPDLVNGAPPKDPIGNGYEAGLTTTSEPKQKILQAGHNLVGRLMVIYPKTALTVATCLVLLLLASLLAARLSVLALVENASHCVYTFLTFPFKCTFLHNAIANPYSLFLIVTFAIVWWIFRAKKPHLTASAHRFFPPRNLLWLVYGLPLILIVLGFIVGAFILCPVTPLLLWTSRRKG